MKRLMDLVLGVTGFLVLLPILSVVGLAVLVCDGSPVFFRQERMGLGGKPFKMWKFRTMVTGAERKGALLTVGYDPRITPLGRFLRKTKIDEFPQLLNVILGEMSLVGPRPEVARYVDKYTPEQNRVLELKPGITDPASLQYIDESELLARQESPEDFYTSVIMPEKIRINLDYAEKANVGTDLKVIFNTLRRIAA